MYAIRSYYEQAEHRTGRTGLGIRRTINQSADTARITSYNVCYTKLLRVPALQARAEADSLTLMLPGHWTWEHRLLMQNLEREQKFMRDQQWQLVLEHV